MQAHHLSSGVQHIVREVAVGAGAGVADWGASASRQ